MWIAGTKWDKLWRIIILPAGYPLFALCKPLHFLLLASRQSTGHYKSYFYLLNLRMEKFIRIFKSHEEQEQYYKQFMLRSSVIERFRKLYLMQQMTRLLHPIDDHSRKIQIRNGHSELKS